MGNALVRDIGAFTEWLNAGREDGARDAAELLALAPDEWDRWLADHPQASSFHVFELLLDEAYDLLTRDPQRAVALTEFVVRHVDNLPIPYEPVRTTLRGRAWIERTNALRQVLELPAALEASARAIAILAAQPQTDVELAAAERVQAITRYLQGDETQPEPVRMVREGMQVFEATNALGHLLRSRSYEGLMEAFDNNFARAEEIFRSGLALAGQLGDERSTAGLHMNLGACVQELGRTDEAVHHLVLALKLFEKHGMPTECTRTVWNLAHLLRDTGRVDLAEAEFKRVADELRDSGLPNEAALVWLDLLDMYVLLERYDEVAARARELVHTFAKAGLRPEVLHALHLLQETATTAAYAAAQINVARTALRETVRIAG